MYNTNLANRAMRQAEVGLVWEEMLSGAAGTIEVYRYATFRVRSIGVTTVTIDGILAMTMQADEIAIFNAGRGDPTDLTDDVTIVIAGAGGFVQVARKQDRTSTS